MCRTLRISGELDGIHFLLDRDVVSEVWLSVLRTSPTTVRCKGAAMAETQRSLHSKSTFVPCTRDEGVIGGVRYLCAPGLGLGFDFKETGAFVQVRVQPK